MSSLLSNSNNKIKLEEPEKNLKQLGYAIRYWIKKRKLNCYADTNLILQMNDVAGCKKFYSYLQDLNMIKARMNTDNLVLDLGKVIKKDNANTRDEWNNLPLEIKEWLNCDDTFKYQDGFLNKNCIINQYILPYEYLKPYLPLEIFESLRWHFLPEYKKMSLYENVIASQNRIKNLEEQVEMLTKMVNKLSNQDSILKQMERARNQLNLGNE